MPTNKNRVAGYLPDDVHERFQAFKGESGLSESKALILILSQYFGVGQIAAHDVAHQAVSRAEFDQLSEKVTQLGSLLHERKSKSELPDKSKSSSDSELLVCVSCGSENLIKAGTTRHGKRRYKCKDCGKHFSSK